MGDEATTADGEFDGIRVGRPAERALRGAGFDSLADLPGQLDELLTLHGVGPAAVRRLAVARGTRPDPES